MAKSKKKKTDNLGPKLKRLRKKTGLSLEELAKQTGLTENTIARVEEEKEIPPVGAILQISKALGLDASGLLSQEKQEVQKKSQREGYKKRSRSYAYKTLAVGAASMHLKAFLVTIEPRQDHEMVEYKHEGEEFLFVLSGEVDVTVGEKKHHLKSGKSLHFNSSIPHMLRNPCPVKTQLIVVLYTP